MTTPHPEAARNMVHAFVSERFHRADKPANFTIEDVYVVWFCYILGNFKALVSTNIPDNMYYEVTFNRSKNRVYIDAYKKFENQEFVFMPEPPIQEPPIHPEV